MNGIRYKKKNDMQWLQRSAKDNLQICNLTNQLNFITYVLSHLLAEKT